TASDDALGKNADGSRRLWMYRQPAGTESGPQVADWPTAVLPYLGGQKNQEVTVRGDFAKVFVCPSDKWNNADPPRYWPGNNFKGKFDTSINSDYVRISYGINVDILCVRDPGQANRTVFETGSWLGVVGGPNSNMYSPGVGDALCGQLTRVYKPAEVALFS